MRLSLMGMSGSGKSYWSRKLAQHGFRRFCCDELIAQRLAPQLQRHDGTVLSLGEWMGFPYEPRYEESESRYLACEIEVLTDILEYLKHHDDTDENIVVDTTGSVIYTGEQILQDLASHTTIVLLSTPPEVREQMFKAYTSKARPILWRGMFHNREDETAEQALTRCYPELLVAREKLYERYAHVTLDYYKRRSEGFSVDDFLAVIGGMGR